MYLPLKDGKKAPIPRYYKERIYTSEEKGFLKGQMEKRANESRAKLEKLQGEKLTHNLVQSHIHSFKKMHKNAKEKGSL